MDRNKNNTLKKLTSWTIFNDYMRNLIEQCPIESIYFDKEFDD